MTETQDWAAVDAPPAIAGPGAAAATAPAPSAGGFVEDWSTTAPTEDWSAAPAADQWGGGATENWA